MQFNSILFPGPGMDVHTDFQNIIYIPRGRLPTQDEEFKEEKLGSSARASSGLFSCMQVSQNGSNPSGRKNSSVTKLAQSNQQMSAAASTQNQQESNNDSAINSNIVVQTTESVLIKEKPRAKQVHASASTFIPAIYLNNPTSSKLLLYFHGNAECLTLARGQMASISNYCNVSVLGIEYPGYGIYQGNGSASEEKIKEDAEYVYKFCLHDMGIRESDIIVFGRSMGSGPASFLAGTFNPRALCLMSAYTSIKRVAADSVGWLRIFVSERFENIQQVTRAECPTFILHGRQDEVIPFHHGQQLAEASIGQPKVFVDRPNMTHNDFNINRDVLSPLQQFFLESQIETNADDESQVPTFKTSGLQSQPNQLQ